MRALPYANAHRTIMRYVCITVGLLRMREFAAAGARVVGGHSSVSRAQAHGLPPHLRIERASSP